jgi:hypothetical protein
VQRRQHGSGFGLAVVWLGMITSECGMIAAG